MDVAVVGGGLIGLASALELADRGLSVRVFDRGDPGAQASWASAGILGPQSEVHAPSPMLDLCRASFALYPALQKRLGADIGLHLDGTLHLAFDDAEAAALEGTARWQRQAGLRIEERRHGGARLALFFPDEGRVDSRRLLDALRAACAAAGVAIERRDIADLADTGARHTVVCAGSWSARLAPLRVFPVRGQMLALRTPPPACVVFGGGGYIVPRGTATLVGATVEDSGFDSRTTTAGRESLLGIARKLGAPPDAEVIDHWAGLRPGTPDGLPYFGRVRPGVAVATGHYRNGVLLTPVSAKIVASLVLDGPPPVDLAPFSSDR